MELTAKQIAFKYLYGINHIVLGKPFKYDRRTNVGNEANGLINSLKNGIDKEAVLKLKRERAGRKRIEETSIFQQLLVKDYLNNKHYIKAIHYDRIEFYDRNHWAKNVKDLKILAILKKTRYEKNNH